MIEFKLETMLLAVPMVNLGATEKVQVECKDGTTFQAKIRPEDPVLFAFARWNSHPRIVVGFPVPTIWNSEQTNAAVTEQLRAEFKRLDIPWPGEGNN